MKDNKKQIYQKINSNLANLLNSKSLELYRIMEFQMGINNTDELNQYEVKNDSYIAEDLIILSKLLTGDESKALTLAMSITLVEHFLRVHHDVQDGNTESYSGIPSVWWKWGPAHAINTGDGLHALARLSLLEMDLNKISSEDINFSVNLLDKAIMSLCEAEFMEINLQDKILFTPEECLNISYKKGAPLYGCTFAFSSLTVKDHDKDIHENFFKLGSYIGAINYIYNDYKAIMDENERNPENLGRILTKKKNLLLANAIKSGDPKTKREIGEMYMKRILTPDDIERLRKIIISTSAIEETNKSIHDFTNKSLEILEPLNINIETKDYVKILLDNLSNEKH